mgnify:CR=1 FL=1
MSIHGHVRLGPVDSDVASGFMYDVIDYRMQNGMQSYLWKAQVWHDHESTKLSQVLNKYENL